MSPRGSFASVMSTGLQNFAYSPEFKPADEDEVSCLIKKTNSYCVFKGYINLFLTVNST